MIPNPGITPLGEIRALMEEADKRTHHPLSASTCHRWVVCPGSFNLCAAIPERKSQFAREGTAAHALLTWGVQRSLLSNWRRPELVIGGSIEGFPCSDLAPPVYVAIDYVLALRSAFPDLEVKTECESDLSWLHPFMGGSPDIVCRSARAGRIWIIDYKHGEGVLVEAENNDQLVNYLLAEIGPEPSPLYERACLVIIQPRHPDRAENPIDSWDVDIDEIYRVFPDKYREMANLAVQPDSPLVPTDHGCQWCRAKGICPAQKAIMDTKLLPLFGPLDGDGSDVVALPIDAIRSVMEARKKITSWLSALEEHAIHMLTQGLATPEQLGVKLVEGRSNRQWAEGVEEEVARAMETAGGEPWRLCTITEAEKCLGKKNTKPEWFRKPPGKPTLAPLEDPRPALGIGCSVEIFHPCLE